MQRHLAVALTQPAEPLLTGKRFTSMILAAESRPSFRKRKASPASTGTRTVLVTPLLREGVADRGDS